jgi:hypothetical protein
MSAIRTRAMPLSPFAICLCSIALAQAPAAPAKLDTSRGDRMLAEYFAAETKKLQDACLADIKTLADWKSKRGEYHRQLLEMLGLDPLPEKTDLKPVTTGRLEHEDFVVEKLHFQSRPGLYVTGNLYLPKKIEKPLPTILYVCGHSRVLGKDGKTPMGAKAGYQHHGAWYARNGYACLTIDTLQLGEIEGIHHGTHRYGMWWWLNRGYTPAGVEAWNCVRALDYLETRPEIDKSRFGVTGRSGGGAYSWWIAAIDDRIKVAVPTAGITDLQNHVVDGTVEGHCDCMFMVNTYRWDYPQVAALVAPRPLLISNTDSDGIFPLDGVVRTFDKVRRIYRLFDSEKRGTSADIALNISPGPHKDTQELNTHEFRWFNHYLKNDDSPIDSRAPKYFQPEQLKVFDKLPADQINTHVHELFVRKFGPARIPQRQDMWYDTMDWGFALGGKVIPFFGAEWWSTQQWVNGPINRLPSKDPFGDNKPLQRRFKDGLEFAAYEFLSQTDIQLPIYIIRPIDETNIKQVVLAVLDEEEWGRFVRNVLPHFVEPSGTVRDADTPPTRAEPIEASAKNGEMAFIYLCPRGVGPTAFDASERKQTQNRRRFYLLGQTLEAMQVWDTIEAAAAVRELKPDWTAPLCFRGYRQMAGIALYASLRNFYDREVSKLELYDLPKTHRFGPYFLNVERFLDMPEAVAMAAEHRKIVLYQDDDTGWEYPQAVAKALHWPDNQIQIRRKPPDK